MILPLSTGKGERLAPFSALWYNSPIILEREAGPMAQDRKSRIWMPLDNAALIFPAIRRKNWNNVFRLVRSFLRFFFSLDMDYSAFTEFVILLLASVLCFFAFVLFCFVDAEYF